MQRRLTLLAGAVVLTLAVPQAAFAAASPPRAARTTPRDRGTAALTRLRSDAAGSVRVQRAADGSVDFVSSTNGRAMLDGASRPSTTATQQLEKYGDAFGIDGSTSTAHVDQTIPSSTGGTVVRSDQSVDGLPVFGGQVVMSLDKDQDVVSIQADTSDLTEVPAAVVSEATARATALAVTARNHHVAASRLNVVDGGRQVYDPAVVHTEDPMGARPVWKFEVTNGLDIRETVLIGTGRGEVALDFNDAPGLDRRICDNAGAHTVSSADQVPVCSTPARTETGPASSVADVNDAFDNLGQVSQTYQELDGIDLTSLIGQDEGGTTSMLSTVRWCYSDDSCPYPNAFWDGTQMVFGAGYAGADDVVGHELTHGYVEHTSGLFAFHESGSINESVADTMGEIVDHQHGTDDDSAWTIGEDLPGGQLRSLKDPTLYGQPDKMTSPLFGKDSIQFDDEGSEQTDYGDVHQNDGVGNKTAYLISQGGTFNGQTVTGIDAGDPTLSKTGRLYLETIPRLTSGSEYADLGRVLGNTCDELASSSTGGFTSADCVSVRAAVAATQLETVPASEAPEAPVSCTVNRTPSILARDDDGINDLHLVPDSSGLWSTLPDSNLPSYATSGTASRFAYDPDPSYGDPDQATLTSGSFQVPSNVGGTYLNFHQAYLLDYEGTTYYDGAQVLVQKLASGHWTTVGGLPWVNGPTRHIVGDTPAGFTGFGGDSHGYGSSQVNLSSLGGQTVRVVFRIAGDDQVAYFGWWIDDIRLYSCPSLTPPSAPRAVTPHVSGSSAVVSWSPPATLGGGITSYRVTRSDGRVQTVSSATHSVALGAVNQAAGLTVSVAAGNIDGKLGPAASTRFYATSATVASSTAKAKKNKTFRLTARVLRRGTSSVVAGMPVLLQRRLQGRSAWSNVSSGTTGRAGTRVWSVRLTKATYYRVVARGTTPFFGSTSAARLVRRR